MNDPSQPETDPEAPPGPASSALPVEEQPPAPPPPVEPDTAAAEDVSIVTVKKVGKADLEAKSYEARLVSKQLAMETELRRARLQAASDYVSFAIAQCLGLFLIVAGTLGMVRPDRVSLGVEPQYLLGVGGALVLGRRMMRLIHRFSKSMEDS